MITEYLHKARTFVKWLVPFVLAVFLLFGCGGSAGISTSGQPAAGQTETSGQPAADKTQESAAGTEHATEQLTAKPAAGTEQTAEQLTAKQAADTEQAAEPTVEEDGSYTGKDEVALYIHTYKKLPGNFITKKQAEKAGWVSKEGNLWEVAPGKSIGGSHFGNYEEQLPDKDGRKWYECDINFDGRFRGAERIIYSNDGLIYYTGDHYKTFEQLY